MLMPAKKYNICPVTGQKITDRVYNKKAKYSHEGYSIMRKQYRREWSRTYYLLKKLAGVGIVHNLRGDSNAIRNIGRIQ